MNVVIFSVGIFVFLGFNFVFFCNDGVIFGMLGGVLWWSFIVFVFVICVWFVVMLFCVENVVEIFVYGVIIGGVLGNVIDCVCYWVVIDFFDFYIGIIYWFVFNMVDVFVVSGVGFLFVVLWISVWCLIKL